MEAHAHTHSASGESHTSRKRWPHYFWEFFMLFLAVSLGFLVENQREHYVEHQREKKFAQLLYEDFKKDTAYINQVIGIKEWRGKKLDSLFYLLSLPDLQKNSTSLYYYTAFADLNIPFNPNDATIQQLRNSGSLRYFRNPDLYNAITQYYSTCSFYHDAETPVESNLFLQASTMKLFDADKISSLTTITPDIRNAISAPKEEMQLLSTDKQIINEFKYHARSIKLNNDLTIMLLKNIIGPQLINLMNQLKNEYHLK